MLNELEGILQRTASRAREVLLDPRGQIAVCVVAGLGFGWGVSSLFDGPINDPLTAFNRYAAEKYRDIDLKPPEAPVWNPRREYDVTLNLIDTLK